MLYSLSVTRTFAARHSIKDHAFCERDGHTYTVTATFSHEELDPNYGYPRGAGLEVFAILDGITTELRHRDLDEMLPGMKTTCPQLAAWFSERLLSFGLRGVTRVEVSNEEERGVVDIESRRA